MASEISSEEIGNIEKLRDSETFEIWNFQVVILFKANSLHKIVNGEEKYENLTKEDEKKSWLKRDAKAQRIIVSTIDKKVLTHIMKCETATEMYTKLCNIYRKDNEQQKCNLLQEFFNYTYERSSDISLHISKLENLAYRLNSLNQNIDEEMLISKILSTLPESYKHFRTAWESTQQSDRTLTNLTARLIAEESMNKNQERKGSSVAFSSYERVCYKCSKPGHISRFCKASDANQERNRSGELKCNNCGNLGHFAKYCKNKLANTSMNNKTMCQICKKTNHTAVNCFFRERNQNKNNNGSGSGSTNNDRKVAFLTTEENGNYFDKTAYFVIDSGSTSHMVNDIKLFKEFEEKMTEICVAKKGTKLKSEGEGTIENEKCILKNVLYVPELTKNLISVSAITENQGEVLFNKNEATVMKNGKKVFQGYKNEKGLYITCVDKRETTEQAEQGLLVENREEKVSNWHRKLGHINIRSMKKMIENEMVIGLNMNKKDCESFETPCEICLRAKQVRLPFDNNRIKATRPLEIIHTDLCGPIDPTTWDDKNYVLTILDDYTHYVVIYLLRCKNEVTEYLKEYVEEMEANQNLRVSKLRSDNGGEYVNKELINWCKKKGIKMDTTIPHTPQLNGKAERLNRTLLEKSRSLIFDSQLDKHFWGEAVRVSAYILNRSPIESLPKTPYEMWTNKKPDLSRMQIFGSDAYAKILGYLKKLDERSERFVFVGYGLNGYRLWDEKKQEIIVRRDVVFKMKPNKNNKIKTCKIKLEDEEAEEIKNQEGDEEQNQNNNEEILEENDQSLSDEEASEEESEDGQFLGQGREDRRGRKIDLPKKYEDYVLLTYNEAITSEENKKWQQAINEEKESLENNKTWEYVDIEKANGKKILSNKWVFRIKEDGKFKARLVVRGCQQVKGLDYEEVFSPVVNVSSLRSLLSLSVQKNYNIKKFDIKTAFLYGTLNDEVFMEIPEGYKKQENKICILKRALYGLKQAPMRWNEHFTNFLRESGLNPLSGEQCIFKNKSATLFLAIYVDDGLIVGEKQEEIDRLLNKLETKFEMKKFDNVKTFLGINITRGENWMKLDQENYIETILERFNMKSAKTAMIPMVDIIEKTTSDMGQTTNFPYREAVGSLLYLSNKTRPDIAFSVGYASRNMENPTKTDINNVKRIMRYLNATKSDGIVYQRNQNQTKMTAYSDADFAGDTRTRKSTSGYVIYYCDGPISWCSRKQPVVALSSTEAEFISAAECVKEILFLRALYEEFLLTGEIDIELKMDNQSAMSIIKNGQFNKRSKHIDVRFHFINEKIKEGLVKIQYLCSENMIADIFTKALNNIKFLKHKKMLVK